MKFELDEERMLELFKQHIDEREKADTIPSLSLIFQEYEDGYQPALFFCPDWEIDFSVDVSLTDALQEYLDEEGNDDEDYRGLAVALLKTINDWKTERSSK